MNSTDQVSLGSNDTTSGDSGDAQSAELALIEPVPSTTTPETPRMTAAQGFTSEVPAIDIDIDIEELRTSPDSDLCIIDAQLTLHFDHLYEPGADPQTAWTGILVTSADLRQLAPSRFAEELALREESFILFEEITRSHDYNLAASQREINAVIRELDLDEPVLNSIDGYLARLCRPDSYSDPEPEIPEGFDYHYNSAYCEITRELAATMEAYSGSDSPFDTKMGIATLMVTIPEITSFAPSELTEDFQLISEVVTLLNTQAQYGEFTFEEILIYLGDTYPAAEYGVASSRVHSYDKRVCGVA